MARVERKIIVKIIKVIRRFENVNKYCEFKYKNNILHGKQTLYFENGNKYWEDNYKNGQLNGKSIGWCENGVKNWEFNFKDGLPQENSFINKIFNFLMGVY